MSTIPASMRDKLPGWMAEFLEVIAANRLFDQMNRGKCGVPESDWKARATAAEHMFVRAVDLYLHKAELFDQTEQELIRASKKAADNV